MLPMEQLENRQLLASVTLTDGILQLTGDNNVRNTMTVTRSGTTTVSAKVGGTSRTFYGSQINEIRITGGNWNDTIKIDTAVGRKTTIKGMDGHDWIKGGGGSNTIYGGNGDDSLYGNYSSDVLYGDSGNDLLDGGSGSDRGDGGSGTNRLVSIESAASGSDSDSDSGASAPGAITSIAVTELQLWDAGTNRFIRNINAGETLDLANLPEKISVRAATSSGVASVRFGLDANSNYRTENVSPYTLSGDASDGKPYALNLSTGSHTIKATPYTKDGAGGTAGPTKSVSFNVVRSSDGSSGSDSGSLPGATSAAVNALQLWNSGNNTLIKTLNSGETLDLGKLPSTLTVVAQVSGTTKSVKFALDSNSSYRTESAAPYSISGDYSGDLANWSVPTGSHTIKATPYSQSGASGTAGASKSVTLNITRSSSSSDGDSGSTDGGSSSGGTSGITPRDSSASSPNAVITPVSSTTIHAGQSFHANAMSSQLNDGTPITGRYVWDFGDSGSKYNVIQGFNASHFYSSPGTYTVKLSVTNAAGKTDTTTRTVSVQSESRRKIYVSTSGSDSNDGLSESRPIRSWGKALTKMGDNIEILFRGGQTFDVKSSMNVHGSNVVVGSYGTGKATLKYSGAKDYTAMIYLGGADKERTVENLVFDSIYTGGQKGGMPQAIGAAGTGDIVKNNEFRNVGYAVNASMRPKGLLVQDNSAPLRSGVKEYFAWTQGSDIALVGNNISNTLYGHDIRSAGTDRLLIHGNTISNPNDPDYGDNVNRSTINLHLGNYIYVSNNTFNQGVTSVGPLGESNGLTDKGGRLKWVVLEGNVVNNSTMLVLHGTEHVMIRNNVHNRDNHWALELEGYSSTYGRGVVDVTIANNTAINDGTEGNYLRVNGDVNGINLINNLYVAPNLITGTEGSAPVFNYDYDLSSFKKITGNVWPTPTITQYAQGGINYVYNYWSNAAGYKTPAEWEAYGEVGKDYYQDVSFSYSNYAPSSSSQAASAGIVWDGVFTDKNGKIRSNSGSWTAGAVEV